ncbi:hypothetical protein CDAR_437601 [Caerostris darwini]|uniref:Uncharacterized protein n=1 Tax=Caerostris darwini TaxID=1538125 RepID=A0AAV4NVD7_9ARAC|nr:hypothetical protein CDAR_437601 [Caerostris darwini]
MLNTQAAPTKVKCFETSKYVDAASVELLKTLQKAFAILLPAASEQTHLSQQQQQKPERKRPWRINHRLTPTDSQRGGCQPSATSSPTDVFLELRGTTLEGSQKNGRKKKLPTRNHLPQR